MKIKSFGIALTVVNLLILSVILTQHKSAFAQQPPLKKVSTQALEIVDSKGHVRASITIESVHRANNGK